MTTDQARSLKPGDKIRCNSNCFYNPVKGTVFTVVNIIPHDAETYINTKEVDYSFVPFEVDLFTRRS